MDEIEQDIRASIHQLIDRLYEHRRQQSQFVPGRSYIQYSGALFDEQEVKAILDSVLAGWFGLSKAAYKLEERLAKALGKNYGVVTNSGSSANLLAIAALKSKRLPSPLQPGDEVITATSAFPTTVNPIIQTGLVPVFVDVQMGNYSIDTDVIEEAVSPRTRALFFAHTAGNPPDMTVVMDVVRRHNLFLIEDCCDAFGGTFGRELLGSFGDMATLSMYPAHHITMGEGGLVATRDEELSRIVRSFRDWGRDCYCQGKASLLKRGTCGKRFDYWLDGVDAIVDHKYVYSEMGYNLKPIEFQCAMGLVQVERLPLFLERRQHNFEQLFRFFQAYEEYFYLPRWHPEAKPSWFAFMLTVRPGAPFDRAQIVEWFEDHKIQTRNLFAGNVLRHPAYRDVNCRVVGSLANSDLIITNTFFLGIYPGISDEMMAYILEVAEEFLRGFG